MEELEDSGIPYKRHGHDEYDCSLELYGVPDSFRLTGTQQQIIRKAGFCRVYVNHENKWETHYNWKTPFPITGWRVSYPHKRDDGDRSIWLEKDCQSWPREWFETGYAVIKEPKCSNS